MTIKKHQKIEFDEEVIAQLDKILPQIPMIVVDSETTGNDPRRHGMLELSALDLRNPNYNFSGESRLREGAHISIFDLKKNKHYDNIGRIIDPEVTYPELDGDNPMLQVNDRFGDRNLEDYLNRNRRIRSILTNKRPSSKMIEHNLKGLMSNFYEWLKPDLEDPDLRITYYQESFNRPSISIVGHNISFDEGFINDGFERTGIGSPDRREIKWPDASVTKPSDIRYFQLPYRKFDTHDVVMDDIQFKLLHLGEFYFELLGDFWKNSKVVDRFDKWPLPTLFNGSGLTLDACLEYVGIPPRLSGGERAKHDALNDVKLTFEAYVRTKVNQPCLKEYKKFELPQHLDQEYLHHAMQQKFGK